MLLSRRPASQELASVVGTSTLEVILLRVEVFFQAQLSRGCEQRSVSIPNNGGRHLMLDLQTMSCFSCCIFILHLHGLFDVLLGQGTVDVSLTIPVVFVAKSAPVFQVV